MSVRRTEDTHAIAEWILACLHHRTLLHTDLHRVHFAVKREVEEALLDAVVHIADELQRSLKVLV